MDYAVNIISFIQLFFAIVIGMYFWNLLKSQQGSKITVERESKKEMEKLQKLREISLTEPLSEKTRPSDFEEIVGQADGLTALKAALCGSNPQHVLIYGPPGVGKTAAARLALGHAKKNALSPFKTTAKFIEIDATAARFDERGIADPLIGTVHDPIYQGAGQMGIAGIPQPKPGAVTKAHGGILFIDEIGELHHIQMNKLLKVLEDRKVFLDSSYYSSEDTNIPQHIHDIFQKGLPADFRLIGATTRLPGEIPSAIRSRCVEIFFRTLLPDEIAKVAQNASQKIDFVLEDKALEVIKRYASNGREAVNIVQIAAGIIQNRENIDDKIMENYLKMAKLANGDSAYKKCVPEEKKRITAADVEWVINFGQYSPRLEKQIPEKPQVGVVNGLAVYGANMGMLMEIEASAASNNFGNGVLQITGVVDEEEIASATGRTIKRKSMAKGSLDNVLTVLYNQFGIEYQKFNIHVNFPGGVPVDGPSAGVAAAAAIYSAVKKIPADNTAAMTGELSIRGRVLPVGGVSAKVAAARQAGARKVIIPRDNWQETYREMDGIEVIAVETLQDALTHVLSNHAENVRLEPLPATPEVLAAAGVEALKAEPG